MSIFLNGSDKKKKLFYPKMKWSLNDRILNSLIIVLNLILFLRFGRTLFFGILPAFYYFYVKIRLYIFNKLILKNIGII